jgi:hypothetical protein
MEPPANAFNGCPKLIHLFLVKTLKGNEFNQLTGLNQNSF